MHLNDARLRDLIFRPLASHRTQVVRFIVSALARSLSAIGIIVLLQQFLSGVLGGEQGLAAEFARLSSQEVALLGIALLLLMAFLIMSLATYHNDIAQEQLTRSVEVSALEKLVRHLMVLPVMFFESQGTGDLMQAMRQDTAHLRGYLAAIVRICMEGLLAVGYTIAAIWMSPSLAFWVLLVMPLAAIPLVIFARKTTHQSFHVRKRNSALMDTVLQIIHGIRMIRIYGTESQQLAATIKRARHYFDAALTIVRLQSFSRVLLESLSGLSIVLIVVIGGFKVLEGTLGWPALMAFLVAVRSLQGPLNNMNSGLLAMRQHAASIVRILELLAEPSVQENASNRTPLTGRIESIRFENVNFARNNRPALNDVSFTVNKGETLAIVGPSGAGKSTVLDLCAGFFPPDRGKVLVNGLPVESLMPSSFYDQVALAPQEAFVFEASVRDNILCGWEETSEEEIVAAAKAAGLHQEILSLPDGYSTLLSIGGQGLSTGQSQRLNIARALLKKPSLLLLDEPTANLDALVEAKIQESIAHNPDPNQIRIIAAHRLATVQHAEQIMVLEHGHCVAIDSHAALVRNCPLYREMWIAQQQADTVVELGARR